MASSAGNGYEGKTSKGLVKMLLLFISEGFLVSIVVTEVVLLSILSLMLSICVLVFVLFCELAFAGRRSKSVSCRAS